MWLTVILLTGRKLVKIPRSLAITCRHADSTSIISLLEYIRPLRPHQIQSACFSGRGSAAWNRNSKVTQTNSQLFFYLTYLRVNYTMYIVHSEYIMLIVFSHTCVLSKYFSPQGSILVCTCLKSVSPVFFTPLMGLNQGWKLKM